MSSRIKKALFGGTFDPIHNGHIALASLALDALDLDEVVFIPAGIPPHKQNKTTTPPEIRLEMVTAAIKPYPRFSVWDGELYRTGPSYTYDTIQSFVANVNDDERIVFIIGSDNLTEIETWYRYTDLLKLVTFAVALRPGAPLVVPESLSSGRFVEIPSPLWGVSSSYLRSLLAKKWSCDGLISPLISAIIQEKNLYNYSDG